MADAPFEREVRFAVVIYGGVSLAIYINGIVQEMLRMVRSTALPESELRYSEKVYRRLACLVGAPLRAEGRPGRAALSAGGMADEPRTRFVIDVLSGTSAGGINAIYLAKALCNGQSLDGLAHMWIDVADIERLLNDRESAEAPLTPQVPPKSLLNSRWMYSKLLEALDGMDDEPTGPHLVEDLDLFSTATDLDGLPLPIALADSQVMERRHRNVYHFRCRGDRNKHGRNDFVFANNPFLAYAARCTSAFPFAFEPMTLSDAIDAVAPGRVPPERWSEFYPDYERVKGETLTPFDIRSFGDGGYLDNKPFSYAIDTVMRRQATVPVDRKLVYIEPSPEKTAAMFRRRAGKEDRPDAIENSLAALVTLPRYETIRQDLDRVIEWNKNIARLRRVIGDVQAEAGDVAPMAYFQSPAYRAYLRIRLSAATDDIADRVTGSLGLDPNSARGDAIRGLAGRWRVRQVTSPADKFAFLRSYDIAYYERAVLHVRKRLRASQEPPAVLEERYRALAGISSLLHQTREAPLPELDALPISAQQRDADLDFVVSPIAAAERNPPGLSAEALDSTDPARDLRIDWLFENTSWKEAIVAAYTHLATFFGTVLLDVYEQLTPLVTPFGGWQTFDLNDSLVFPLVFGTNLGEREPIDIIRISPDDTALLAGLDDGPSSGPKIKGQMYGAFGAFLDRGWRLHDMLRGRLDAAERLITAVLPSSEPHVQEIREELIRSAQEEAAREWAATFGEA